MIATFIYNFNGSLQSREGAVFNQGSIGVDSYLVIAPFTPSTKVYIKTKRNGDVDYSLWKELDYNPTLGGWNKLATQDELAVNGELQIVFKFNNLTTEKTTVWIREGVLILPQYTTYEQLRDYALSLSQRIDYIVNGTTGIAFNNDGTDLESEFVEHAIKEVNEKVDTNNDNILNGFTIVKKAEQDSDGNVIKNTYETKTIVSGINSHVTSLENANMVKSVSYQPMTHIITFTFYDNTTQSLDLPLESTIIGASYDNVTKDITFTLQNGSTLVVPLDDLVIGLASETWVTTYFIPKTSIVDNLTTNDATKVLSAKQGKELKDTKEALANKAVDFSIVDDIKYPTTKAVSERLLNLPIQELNNKTLKEFFEDSNLVMNGDFTNGIAEWQTPVTSTGFSASDGIAKFTATAMDGRIRSNFMNRDISTPYYIVARFKANSPLVFIQSNNFSQNGGNHSGNNTFEIKSLIITGASTPYWNVGIIDKRTSDFSEIEVDYVFAYNLQEIGTPTIPKQRLDYWFNVYKGLKTSETDSIFSMFAPKQQEAWITPTLTGATSTYIRYRKDTLGTVIVEGNITVTTAGTNLTLPVGYRPLFAYTVGILTFNTDGTVVSSATGTQTLSVRYTGA